MPRDKGTSDYYRLWCDTLALFYDALTAALGLLVGGEMRFHKKVALAAPCAAARGYSTSGVGPERSLY